MVKPSILTFRKLPQKSLSLSIGVEHIFIGGYLIELAKELGISKIYTVDEELAKKFREIEIKNPILLNVLREYHQYIRENYVGPSLTLDPLLSDYKN